MTTVPPSYDETIQNQEKSRLIYSDEDFDISTLNFKPARLTFIRKVYSILSIQLLFTSLICVLFMYNDDVKSYVQGPNGITLLYTSIFLNFAVLISLVCCNLIRNYPYNFIGLGLFTICNSYMLGVVTSYSDTTSVILAAGATCAITFGLTMYSILTKRDFTTIGGGLFSLLIVLIFMGIASIFIHNRIYDLVYAGLGALVFSIYIIHDTQLIVGGKHKKYEFLPDDYVLAALTLYLDIINLFLYILEILNER